MKTIIEGVLSGDLPWGLVLHRRRARRSARCSAASPASRSPSASTCRSATMAPIFVGGCVRALVRWPRARRGERRRSGRPRRLGPDRRRRPRGRGRRRAGGGRRRAEVAFAAHSRARQASSQPSPSSRWSAPSSGSVGAGNEGFGVRPGGGRLANGLARAATCHRPHVAGAAGGPFLAGASAPPAARARWS